jgi:hypothetical protein
MPKPNPELKSRAKDDASGLRHLAEDSIGVGMIDLRTVWAIIVRPARSLDAYMRLGPTAGGTLTRPLRLYLTLNAALVGLMLLSGGVLLMWLAMFQWSLPLLIAMSALEWAWWVPAGAGSHDMANSTDMAGQWTSLIMPPLSGAIHVVLLAPLLRWWDPEVVSWREACRATFVYLSAVTASYIPLASVVFLSPAFPLGWSGFLMIFLAPGMTIYSFLRMGRNRWFRSWASGVLKAAALLMVTILAQFIAMQLLTIAFFYSGGLLRA